MAATTKVTAPKQVRIHRTRQRGGFTSIPNTLIRDTRLSRFARSVLAEILSHDPTWRATADDMWHAAVAAGRKREGRDVYRRAFAELESAGYMTRSKVRDERGLWETVLHFYDVPATGQPGVGPVPEQPAVGQPGVGNSGAIPKTETKKETKKMPPPPSSNGQVVATPATGGGDQLSDEKRAAILRWLRDSGKRQPSAYLAKVTSNGNLAELVADYDAAQERPGELAWWKEGGSVPEYMRRDRGRSNLTEWEIMNGRTSRQPELEPGFWDRKNCPACGWRNGDDCADAGRHFGHMATSDQRAAMAILAGQRVQARQERDSAGQVALPPAQTAPTVPAPTPARLSLCPGCQRTLRLDAGKYPEHDGQGGRRCPDSGTVSYQAAAAVLSRRAV